MTPSDTFPRQHARTQRFTLGAPRNLSRSPPTASRVAFLRPPGPRTRSRRCGCSTSRRATSGGRRPRPSSSPATPPTCRPRSASAASAPGRARPGSPATPPTPSHRRWRRPWPGQLVVADLVARHRGDRAGAQRGDRPAARSHRRRGWRGSTAGSSGCSSSTTRRRPACWPARTTPRCGGAWRSSSPPRRWTGTAATGGRPTARRCSPPGWTTRRCSGGGSPTPPTPTARRPRWPTPPPAPRTPTSRAWILGLDGTRTRGHVGPRRPPLPGRGRLGRPRSAARAPPARPAAARGPRRRPAVGRHGGALDGPRRRLGGAGPGHAGPARRRAAGRVLRRRRARAGSWSAARPSRPTTSTSARSPMSAPTGVVFTANPIDDATGTSVWRWTRRGLEQLTADDGVHTAVVGGDTVVVRRASARQTTRPPSPVVGGPAIAGDGRHAARAPRT